MDQLHAGLVAGALEFSTELDKLLNCEEWGDFTDLPPDFASSNVMRHVHNVQSIACSGGHCRARHEFQSIDALTRYLHPKQRTALREAFRCREIVVVEPTRN